MYKSILSSWVVRIVLALFIAAVVYVTIEAFKDGYYTAKKVRAEMEARGERK